MDLQALLLQQQNKMDWSHLMLHDALLQLEEEQSMQTPSRGLLFESVIICGFESQMQCVLDRYIQQSSQVPVKCDVVKINTTYCYCKYVLIRNIKSGRVTEY